MTFAKKWNECKPIIFHLKFFGSEVYMHILNKLGTKLNDKWCILILYHMPIKIVKISRDGVFNAVKLFLTSNLVKTFNSIFWEEKSDQNLGIQSSIF